MTPGRAALLAVLQRTQAQYVAARLGVSPSRVSEWASGKATPSPAARRQLASIYLINERSWSPEAKVGDGRNFRAD